MARKRTTHSGIQLVARRRRDTRTLEARWTDPETGQVITRSLTAMGFTTKEAARQWCEEQSKLLVNLRKEVSATGPRPLLTTSWDAIHGAFREYLTGNRSEQTASREMSSLLRCWGAWIRLHRGIRTGADLNPFHLHQFRTWLLQQPLMTQPNSKREAPARGRTATTLNRYLSVTKSMLNWARRAGYVRLDRDSIFDGLQAKPREMRPMGRYFSREDLATFIRALVEHDSTRCTITREKHDIGKAFSGRLPSKYVPLAPYGLLLLLTGMRADEALHLKWEDVDFEHFALHVRADTQTGWRPKTRQERVIPLNDSPMLVLLLRHLKLKSNGGRYVIAGGSEGGVRHISIRLWRSLRTFGLPATMTRQALRSNAVSYVCCAPIICTVHMLEARFGHSQDVQRAHYLKHLLGITGATVEQWMGVEREIEEALNVLFRPQLATEALKQESRPA